MGEDRLICKYDTIQRKNNACNQVKKGKAMLIAFPLQKRLQPFILRRVTLLMYQV